MERSGEVTEYRKDINGLRGWAVVAVLLFHFKVPGFGAGFLGVDAFFVISGYLMTSIVLSGLEHQHFSLRQFYIARARRIVPALLALLLILLALGWFYLATPDYQSLGAQATSAVGFFSNFHYWQSAGYFDAVADEKWLLHTWSLGIEMQFYLLYPLLALGLWKIKPGTRFFTTSLGVIFVLSLILSIIISYSHPVAAFYLLPTRAWELAAGGLVYLAQRHSFSKGLNCNLIYLAGLALWLSSFIAITNATPWPSAWALLPVVGTALIILSANKSARLLTNPLLQWLGNISYSLYLWHWPIVVALYFSGQHNSWYWLAAGLVLSLIMGHLSWQFVEQPSRRYLLGPAKHQQTLPLAIAAAATAAVAICISVISVAGRLPADVEMAAAESRNINPRQDECLHSATANGSPACIYGDPNIGVILLGDSHADSTVTALAAAAENRKMGGVLFLAMNSCPTLDQVVMPDRKDPGSCQSFNQWANSTLSEHPDIPLVVVNRTSFYLMGPNEPEQAHLVPEINADNIREFQQALISTACRLAQDRPVYLMRPVPEFGIPVYRTLLGNYYKNGELGEIKMPLAQYHNRNYLVWEAQDKAAELCGVKILDPLPYLCDEEFCYGSRNGRPLYSDDDHLSEYGNKLLVPMFEQVD